MVLRIKLLLHTKHSEAWFKYMDLSKEILINSNGIMTGKSLPITGGREIILNASKYFKDQLPDVASQIIYQSP